MQILIADFKSETRHLNYCERDYFSNYKIIKLCIFKFVKLLNLISRSYFVIENFPFCIYSISRPISDRSRRFWTHPGRQTIGLSLSCQSYQGSRSEFQRRGQMTGSWKSRIALRSQDTSLAVYITYVVPVLLYGSKTWVPTKSDERRIDAFGWKCLRCIWGVRWSDFIPNVDQCPASVYHHPEETSLLLWSYYADAWGFGMFVASWLRDCQSNVDTDLLGQAGDEMNLHTAQMMSWNKRWFHP